MKFQRGDIVLSAVGWTAGCFVITKVDLSRPKNCYNGLNVINRKQYRLNDDSLSIKIGVATEEFLRGEANPNVTPPNGTGNPATSLNYERGKQRAEQEVRYSLTNSPSNDKWKILAEAKPGDLLRVIGRGGVETVSFQYVCEKGEKYVFAATNQRGKLYRYALHLLLNVSVANGPINTQQVATALAKRTDAAILADLQNVECQLSPENLTCDGELPRSEVLKRQSRLQAQRAALVKELGREPTTDELYPGLFAR